MERANMASVMATEARKLRAKATDLAKDKSIRRLLLSRRLDALVDSLWTVQWACGDAEKQPENNPKLEEWLVELREKLFLADDLLDMIRLRRLPRKRRGASAASYVSREFLFSIPLVLHFAAGCRLKLAARTFNAMAMRVRSFCKDDVRYLDRPHPLPAKYFGTEEDKKKLIGRLSHGEKLSVIPILGMAGLGKSTLARFIYYDQWHNYNARMLVSRTYSTGEAKRRIMSPDRSVPHSKLLNVRSRIEADQQDQEQQPPLEFPLLDRDGHHSFRRAGNQEVDFEVALKEIMESLNGLKFLLVLLDINKISQPGLFKRLMQTLENASRPGSTVILTTTSEEVASMSLEAVAAPAPEPSRPSTSSSVSTLTRQDSWKLFKEHASLLHLPDEHHFWHPGIIDDCRGHPLSVIIMAKKMRRRPLRDYFSFGRQPAEAEAPQQDLPRLSSELQQMYEKLIFNDPRGDQLSEMLRNCFTYLSLFPEDHHFCKEELVDLWAAENSISLSNAENYFEIFRQERAFVPCDEDDYDESIYCREVLYKMRDLLPYFAQHVSSKNVHLALSPHSFDLLQLDPKEDRPVCQHLSFFCDAESSGFPIDILFEGPPWMLRTLLLLGPSSSDEKCWVRDIDNIKKLKTTFKYMRILHADGITFGNLLEGIGKYSNLVYLNVSRSDVEKLPESFVEFANLKILKLSYCEKLARLPRSIDRLLHLEKLDLEGCVGLAKNKFRWVVKLFRLEHLNLSRIDFASLPRDIGKLRHLKALILAHCRRIQMLPQSTSKLLSLEILDLQGCYFLKDLPECSGSGSSSKSNDSSSKSNDSSQQQPIMKNLKVLNSLHCSSLTRMPSGLDRLLGLQSLTRYVVARDDDKNGIRDLGPLSNSDDDKNGIRDLGPLSNLKGELWLDKLHNLTNPQDAADVKLDEKDNLRSLTLRWELKADHEPEAGTAEMQEEVIDALKPTSKMRWLKLISYAGKQFPPWMTTTAQPPHLENLVDVKLFNIKSCELLPPLGQLPLLRVAEISGMDGVAELDDSFYGPIGTFRSLERLTLSQMLKLKSWTMPTDEAQPHRKKARNGMFPRLAHLTFMRCPKLEPPRCPLPSIKSMTMWFNNEMLYDSAEGLKSMAPAVEKLSIAFCQDLWADPSTCEGFWGLTSLQEVEISECHNLASLPEGIKRLTSLKTLSVVRCSNMRSLPEWLYNDVPSLRSFAVSACPKLRPTPWPRGRRPLRRNPDLRVSVEGCRRLRYY